MKPRLAESVGDRQLLWIDLLGRDVADLEAVAAAAGIEKTLAQRLTEETGRADLTQYPEYIHLVLEAMEAASETSESSDDPLAPQRRAIDLIAGRNWVVTIHTEASPALQRIDDLTRGPTQFGALDAGGFLAAIVDEVLAGYLGLAEAIEQEIDRLDERTLRTKPRGDVLARIVMLRRRIGTIRRALTPHRLAFAALARPEIELHEELGRPLPRLTDRLERVIDAVENLRDLLLGTYDIYMGRTAHDANEIMKRLTLLSAILLPAVVLGGIMGMNFKVEFFENAQNFWYVVGAMVPFATGLLVVARWCRWL